MNQKRTNMSDNYVRKSGGDPERDKHNDVTVWSRTEETIETIRGPVSYEAWCTSEVNRMNRGRGSHYLATDNRRCCCVARL